ncbi:MAG: ElyC/SanA/YdcF family protein [Fulvivirga sp.]
MKGLKFLIFLAVVFILIVLFMLPFYYSNITAVLSDLNAGTRSLSTVYTDATEYMQHMDSWSILGFVFLASCIMIIHGIVDYFLLYRLNKFYSGTFVLDGLLWLSKRLLSLLFTALLFMFLSNLFVDFFVNMRIAGKTEEIKKDKYTVLLLGTNKFLQDGKSENVYYTYRIDAVHELYEAGYIKEIWVSGDNSNAAYNEPQDMKKSLVMKGIPADIIRMDFAGFRTLDSIVRSKETFGLQEILIVSQGFHLQRAIFLAYHFGLSAIGYEAKGNMNLAMFVREHLAVPKMVLDIVVLNTQPQFGSTGERRQINFGQTDLVLMSFVLILFALGSFVSYDAFDFGK